MKLLFTVVMAMCLMFAACDKITPGSSEPVRTGKAAQITQNSAILWGSANPSSLAPGVELGIFVSESEYPTVENAKKLVSMELDKNNMFFVEATGLKAETKYYYKAFLNVGGTYRVGEVKSFTTEEYRLPSGAVDLGLPSGLLWASCNVGANAPEEYGDYFAWGEVEPYYSSQDPLTWKSGKSAGYDWASYKWCNGSFNTQTKYCTDSSYGTVDNKTVLDPEDDAAAVNLSGSWRMPTDAEWTELRTDCTWTWTMQNGVNGRLVTGPSGNSIFLPAAGYRSGTYLYGTGSLGYYWSSSLRTGYPSIAYDVYFSSGYVYRYYSNRYYGQSVRPVTE